MIYVGMDISSKSFMVHAINSKKKVVFNSEIKPTLGGLRQMIKDLGRQTSLRVMGPSPYLPPPMTHLQNCLRVRLRIY